MSTLPVQPAANDDTPPSDKQESRKTLFGRRFLEYFIPIVTTTILMFQLWLARSTVMQANELDRVRNMPIMIGGVTVNKNNSDASNETSVLRYSWTDAGTTRATDVFLEWNWSYESPIEASPYAQNIQTSAVPPSTGPYSDIIIRRSDLMTAHADSSFLYVYARNEYSDILCTDASDSWDVGAGHCSDSWKHVHIRKTCVRINRFDPSNNTFAASTCPNFPDCDDAACKSDYRNLRWKYGDPALSKTNYK